MNDRKCIQLLKVRYNNYQNFIFGDWPNLEQIWKIVSPMNNAPRGGIIMALIYRPL